MGGFSNAKNAKEEEKFTTMLRLNKIVLTVEQLENLQFMENPF